MRKKGTNSFSLYKKLVATGIPPWVQRASDMKAEVVINHDMERKLQQHSEEIFKLIKDIKAKVNISFVKHIDTGITNA